MKCQALARILPGMFFFVNNSPLQNLQADLAGSPGRVGRKSSLLTCGGRRYISETIPLISEMLNDISLAWSLPGSLKSNNY